MPLAERPVRAVQPRRRRALFRWSLTVRGIFFFACRKDPFEIRNSPQLYRQVSSARRETDLPRAINKTLESVRPRPRTEQNQERYSLTESTPSVSPPASLLEIPII